MFVLLLMGGGATAFVALKTDMLKGPSKEGAREMDLADDDDDDEDDDIEKIGGISVGGGKVGSMLDGMRDKFEYEQGSVPVDRSAGQSFGTKLGSTPDPDDTMVEEDDYSINPLAGTG